MSHRDFEMTLAAGFPMDLPFKVRVPAEVLDDLERELRDAGFETSRVAEFSLLQELSPIVIGGGVASGLGPVLWSFFHRHDGKRFRVTRRGGETIEADGYSASQLQRIVQEVEEEHRETSTEWQEIAGTPKPTGPRLTTEQHWVWSIVRAAHPSKTAREDVRLTVEQAGVDLADVLTPPLTTHYINVLDADWLALDLGSDANDDLKSHDGSLSDPRGDEH